MAKKTHPAPSKSAKKPGARAPVPVPSSSKRPKQEAPAVRAPAKARAQARKPESAGPRGSQNAPATPPSSDADNAHEPVRWPHLPEGAREVLGLYELRAAELCFPGVTFESLAAHSSRIDRLVQNVEKVKLELATAQAAQSAAESELVEATRRAFAYAQVYAQEHPELHAELEAFVYAKGDKPRRKKREAQAKAAEALEGATERESTTTTPAD